MLLNLFRQKCDVGNAKSFAKYIEFLKLIKNKGETHPIILEAASSTYYKFAIEKPKLFTKNLGELFELDDLYQRLHELYANEIKFYRTWLDGTITR